MDSNDRVCSRCGGSLINKKIWGEDFERCVCNRCQRIDYGVPKNIYDVVNKYVREHNYSYYSPNTWEGHVVSKEEKDLNTEENVRHLCNTFWSLLTEYDKT